VAGKNLWLRRIAHSVGWRQSFLKQPSAKGDTVERHRGASETPGSLTAANDDLIGNAREYPYLVVRIFAAVYQREKIWVFKGPPAVDIVARRCFVQHLAPLLSDGTLSPDCRRLLVAGVEAAVRQLRSLRMCIVWAPTSCTYVQADSTFDSAEPPSGGDQGVYLQFAPQHYKPEAT
jgi:hypothetical protein